jgi:phenylalanine-4-hydroxylase
MGILRKSDEKRHRSGRTIISSESELKCAFSNQSINRKQLSIYKTDPLAYAMGKWRCNYFIFSLRNR